MDFLKKKECLLQRYNALKSERSTWVASWMEISDYIQPRRTRFFNADRNRTAKKNQKIINSTPTQALNALSAGMHEGITSPAWKWFRLTTSDPEMAETGSARSWLHVLEERTYHALARSNIYKSFPVVYQDLGAFGTSAMLLEEDHDKVFHSYVFPVGSYCLATNERGEVDTIYRDASMTVGQMVDKFTKEKCSLTVQRMYEEGQLEKWVDIIHAIEPNKDYTEGKIGPAGKKWISLWLEVGGDNKDFLRVSGYSRFPIMAPRWQVTGEDVYGSCPGMEVIGDAKALQLYERRKAQLVDKIVDPPLVGPAALRNQRVSLAPGATTYVDNMGPNSQLRPIFEPRGDAVTVIEASIREHENRINTAFKKDVFLMLSNSQDNERTAREVSELHEEKMLQLGPVFGQVDQELLSPVIEYVMTELMVRGLVDPPPPELQGQDIKVEYLSVVAAAQKIIASQAVQQLTTFVANLAGVFPQAADKLNVDQVIDEMGSNLGVKPELLNSDDQVQAVRQQRAQQQAKQAQLQQAQVAAEGAKTLSQADTSGDNGLTRLLQSSTPGAALGGVN